MATTGDDAELDGDADVVARAVAHALGVGDAEAAREEAAADGDDDAGGEGDAEGERDTNGAGDALADGEAVGDGDAPSALPGAATSVNSRTPDTRRRIRTSDPRVHQDRLRTAARTSGGKARASSRAVRAGR